MEVDSITEKKADMPAPLKSTKVPPKSAQAPQVQNPVKTAHIYAEKPSDRPSKAEKETPPADKMKAPKQPVKMEPKMSDKDKPKTAIDKKEAKVLPDKKEKSEL
jgi:hypothetical protein